MTDKPAAPQPSDPPHLSDEEIAGIKEGLADVAAGRTKPIEQIRAELNSQPDRLAAPPTLELRDSGIWQLIEEVPNGLKWKPVLSREQLTAAIAEAEKGAGR